MTPEIILGLKVDLTINPGRDRQGAQMRALIATARKRIEGILTVHVKGLKIIPIEILPQQVCLPRQRRRSSSLISGANPPTP